MAESGWAGAEAIIAWSRKKESSENPKKKIINFLLAVELRWTVDELISWKELQV